MTAAPPAERPDRRVAVTFVALTFLALAATLTVRATGSEGEPGGTSQVGDPSLGDPDAPVEVVEYSDFGCPFCMRHAQETKPAIVADYVDTGVVRYVWRDLPLQGEASVNAALAARAAQEQGGFWEYHEVLFSGDGGDLSYDGLVRAAAAAGLDVEALEQAFGAEEHLALINAGIEEAAVLGLSGTPSFTVNGQLVVGAQPYEVFQSVIDEAAREAGR